MMMKLKRLLPAARVLLIICIPFLLFTAIVAVAFNSGSLYEYGFKKYDVNSTTGIALIELTRAAEELIAYFNSSEEFLDIKVEKDGVLIDLYTEEESIHMYDVKGLLQLNYGVLLGTGLFIALYSGLWLGLKKPGRKLVRDYFFGSSLTLLLMLVMGLGFLMDFDKLFYQFHLLVFSNEHWSARGYMLQMFPGGFWNDVVLYCALAIGSTAVIISLVTGGWLYFSGKGLHFHRLMS